MQRKKRTPLTLPEKLAKVKAAGLNPIASPNPFDPYQQNIENMEERIERVLSIYSKAIKPLDMIYFVMYDIENNKVRNLIAKYLKKNGCIRVQRSVFLASSDREKFNEIHTTLKQIQEFYDNNDSIVVVPVSADSVRSMKIIGQKIEIDLALGNRNTLFF